MIEHINKKITKIDTYFDNDANTQTEREAVYARMIKLNEEVGELAEAILYEHDPYQREKNKTIDLDEELADVLICTLLLAERRDKDIWSVVDTKLDLQLKRFNLD